MSLVEESQWNADRGQHYRAFQLIDDERQARLEQAGPVDPEFERLWQDRRRVYLLEMARRYIFLEYEREALRMLGALEAVQPDNPEIPLLRERAIYKLAEREAEKGRVFLSKQMLTEAIAHFLEAERILPTLAAAHEGQAAVREQVDKLTARAQQQFLEALRKMPQFRYAEVNWHSSNAVLNDPDREDAEALRARAQRELALAAVERGEANERSGEFGAALMEYRLAKVRMEELPEEAQMGELARIDVHIADVERELGAQKLADTAQMRMRQKRYDDARADLEKAFEMSVLLRAEISELMIQNREMRGLDDYQNARDLEIQGKKAEAAAAFRALAATFPDGLEDEQVRAEVLQSDIDACKTELAAARAAEAKGELSEAIEHYRAAQRFYERLADAEAKIAELEGKLAEEAVKNGGS